MTNIGFHYEKVVAPRFFPEKEIVWASSEENRIEKWDFSVDGIRYEVKSPKRNIGHGVLVEHTGISGHPGWIQGNADWIMQFRTESICLFYDRAKLAMALLDHFDYPHVDLVKRQWPSETKPFNEWLGRHGKSRIGLSNKDVFIILEPEFIYEHAEGYLKYDCQD